jgi:hypothetical protein
MIQMLNDVTHRVGHERSDRRDVDILGADLVFHRSCREREWQPCVLGKSGTDNPGISALSGTRILRFQAKNEAEW